MNPEYLYAHINAPKSAICARIRLTSVIDIDVQTALTYIDQVKLTRDEIVKYIGDYNSIGCYNLGKIELAPHEAHIAELASKLVYHPPQSFLVLSQNGSDLLDEICGFEPRMSRGGRP
jgi:hypothetical protein